jgi:hypothetical protein
MRAGKHGHERRCLVVLVTAFELVGVLMGATFA